MPANTKTEETLVMALCKVLNNPDVSYTENNLAHDFEYTN